VRKYRTAGPLAQERTKRQSSGSLTTVVWSIKMEEVVEGVLGLGAGAMENRCDLDDTKELAPVPGAGRSIAEASALSIVELALTSSF